MKEYKYISLGDYGDGSMDIGEVLTLKTRELGNGWEVAFPFDAQRWGWIFVRERAQ